MRGGRIRGQIYTLLNKADALPWKADIDDPDSSHEEWTGKFYTGNGSWCTYDDEERSRNAAKARLIAFAVNQMPLLFKLLEEK